MDYVMLVKFADEAKAREAYDKIYANRKDADYTIHDMALVKKEDDRIFMPDGYSVGVDSKDDAVRGGLLGALIGLLGGPIGVLVGASVGVGAGAIADNLDVDEEDAMLYKVATLLWNGETALAAAVSETDDGAFEAEFATMDAEVLCWNAADVAAEVDNATHLQDELAREARERLRVQDEPSAVPYGG